MVMNDHLQFICPQGNISLEFNYSAVSFLVFAIGIYCCNGFGLTSLTSY